MKIQSVFINKTEHYSITLPKRIVEFIGWRKGLELEAGLEKRGRNNSKTKTIISFELLWFKFFDFYLKKIFLIFDKIPFLRLS